jgi:hypothetical protein
VKKMDQFYGLYGRKKNPTRVSEINAQAAYLPQLYSARKDQEFRDKQFSQNQSNFERGFAFQQEQEEERRKQADKAGAQAWANLGLTGALGAGNLAMDYFDSGSEAVPELTTQGLEPLGEIELDPGLTEMSFVSDAESEGTDWLKQFTGEAGQSLYDTAVNGIFSGLDEIASWF